MLHKISLIFFLCFLLLHSAIGMFGAGLYAEHVASDILKRNALETSARQRSYTEQANSSCLDQRASDIASCSENDFMEADQPSDTMNLSAASPVPPITLEDCREALKKYPNSDRLVLQQNQKTGKVSFVAAPEMSVVFSPLDRSQENQAALQSVKNLIAQHIRSFGHPSTNYIDYHPHLLHRIDFGLPLDSETLRRVLFHTTGTIHGAEGDYEYQACLADPRRHEIEDLPEGYIPPHEIFQALEAGVTQIKEAVSQPLSSPSERIPFAKLGNNRSYGSITPSRN